MSDVMADLRLALRQLRRSPVFAAVTVAALGITIAASVTVFGGVNALLFRRLDASDPDRLVRVFAEGGSTPLAFITNSSAYIPLDDYEDYRERNQTFVELAAQFIGGPSAVRTDGPAQMIPVMPVSGNFFAALGVPAAIGRTFDRRDAQFGAREVVVLSDAGWRRFFGGDPGIVGRTAIVDGIPRVIVGVTPPWFNGPNPPMVPQMYAPIIERPAGAGASPFRVWLTGRLKPGVTLAQAHADLRRIAAQLTAADRQVRVIEVYPAIAAMPPLLTPMSLAAAIFAAIAGVVFLIACDNIAILTVVRSAARRREVAIRIALGARTARVVRQLLIETLAVCVPGTAVGVIIAWMIAAWLELTYAPTPMPFALTFPFDWRVALFATGITVVATLLCGLAPALQALREDIVSSLHAAAGATRASVRSALIVTQVTLSTALLVAALALAQSLARSADEDRGFVTDDVLLSTVNTVPRDYGEAERAALFEQLLGRLERTPGVWSVAAVDNIPVANNAPPSFDVVTVAEQTWRVQTPSVSRGFFETLQIPVRAGRTFTLRDSAGQVGIVNETLARMLAPDGTPLGLQLRRADGSLIEIVGVVRNSRYGSQPEPEPLLYRPLGQRPPTTVTFFIKTRGDVAGVFAAVRRAVAEIDPDLVPYNLMTFDERLALSTILNRAAATVSGGLGVLVLALGAIGIFGAMSLLVQQRHRELAVRLALGAPPRQVLATVLGQGLKWTAPGLVLGLALGMASTFGLSRALRGVAVLDPVAFLVTPVLLAAVAAVACLVPALRASRVDPLVALQTD